MAKQGMFGKNAMIAMMATIFLQYNCQQEAAAPPQPVDVLQKFTSGEVSRRHTELNGKKEGAMIDYYPDGNMRAVRHFKNDVQVGRSVFYYPKGEMKEVQYFDENGLKQGGDTIFYENGKPQLLLNFKDGKKHGYVRKWSPEGLMIFEARYELDMLVEVKGKKINNHRQQ